MEEKTELEQIDEKINEELIEEEIVNVDPCAGKGDE